MSVDNPIAIVKLSMIEMRRDGTHCEEVVLTHVESNTDTYGYSLCGTRCACQRVTPASDRDKMATGTSQPDACTREASVGRSANTSQFPVTAHNLFS